MSKYKGISWRPAEWKDFLNHWPRQIKTIEYPAGAHVMPKRKKTKEDWNAEDNSENVTRKG